MKKLFALLMAVMMCVCMVSGLAETAGEAYKIGVVIHCPATLRSFPRISARFWIST